MFGQDICLLPRPLLSNEQLEILNRLENDQQTYLRFEPVLGWDIRPNRTVQNQGATYTSNDIGIRALRSYSLEAPDGVTRIGAFGPSFTHGDEVSDESTWTYMLEEDRTDLEVMNWGVGGYGTDQAFLRYKNQGARYGPHIVLIGYEDENIYRNMNRFRPFYQSRTERPLTKPVFALEGEGLELLPNPFDSPAELRAAILGDPNSFLDTICPTDYHCVRPAYQPSALDRLKSYRLLRTLVYALTYPRYDASRGTSLVGSYTGSLNPFEETTLRLLRDFVEEARHNDAVPVVIFFPTSVTMAEYSGGERFSHEAITTHLRDEGIRILDLTDTFLAAMRENNVDFDAFLSSAGGHYNEAGNRLVSQAILDYLVQSGLYQR